MSSARWVFSLVTAIAIWQLSCSAKDSLESDLAVTNGQSIKEESFAAIVNIAYSVGGGEARCTGTFISHNTLLTAAHCVEEGRAVRIVKASKSVGVSSIKVIRNNNVKRNGFFYVESDMALVLFPDNTAPAIIPIASVKAQANDPIVIVGYGNNDHGRSLGAGIKRMGRNRIKQVSNRGTIDFVGVVRGSGTGEQAVQSQGDSGGPMLTKYGIVGVASVAEINSEAERKGSYTGTHGEVLGAEGQRFLQSGMRLGALIPWFDTNPGLNETFWEFGYTNETSAVGLNLALISCSDDQASCRLGASSLGQVQDMKLCKELTVSECKDAPASAEVLTLSSHRSANGDGRSIYVSAGKIALGSGTWTVVAKKSDGKVEAKKFRVTPVKS